MPFLPKSIVSALLLMSPIAISSIALAIIFGGALLPCQNIVSAVL